MNECIVHSSLKKKMVEEEFRVILGGKIIISIIIMLIITITQGRFHTVQYARETRMRLPFRLNYKFLRFHQQFDESR